MSESLPCCRGVGRRGISPGPGADETYPVTSEPSPYAFRPAARGDLPLLRAWLRTPEIVRWWGDPREQAALLEEDLDEPRMVMKIVTYLGQPFAYAQHYPLDVWPQPHFARLPPGARAIDTFIGAPDMIGRGHGSAYLRLLAMQLLADGASTVAIDPAAENFRACRAYEKAGFRRQAVVETAGGPAIVMVFEG
jgi:aminoglycoside 6'-N-acetyltransferase